MGDSRKTMKKRILKSKLFVFILGVIIGSTYTYIIVVGADYYRWMKRGLINIDRIEIVKAEASEVLSYKGSLVPAGENQDTDSLDGDTPSVEGIIKKYFGSEAEQAMKIAQCESSLRPDATHTNSNGSVDCGLFQINSIHGYDCEELKDVEFNVKIAKKLYDKSGWQPWVCRNVIN
jgi:hypothetical protein